MPTFPGNLSNLNEVENWGYNFVGSAIDNLLRDLESPGAPEAYLDFRERRERALQVMFELVGQEPCLFYVRRKGSGREPGEEIWELTLATDQDNVQLPARLEKLQKTFGLVAAVPQDGFGGLRLLSTRLLPRVRGQADGFSVPCRIRLLPNHQHNVGIPRSALTRLSSMPVCGDYVPTEDQLQAWNAFLEVERRIAEARQFCVPLVRHNYGSARRRITFEIDATSATLDGSPEHYLNQDDFWQRAKRARNEDIKLFETASAARKRNSRQLGTIEEVDPSSSIIRVRLERDLADYIAQGRYHMPAGGFLFFEARGEIAQIERKKKALEDLKKGNTQNPYLGRFLFDVSQARPRQKKVRLQPQDLLLPISNPNQRSAVEAVLSAPDLVLIQGPPGTGKTTVIAEICYQVACRGGRTLIASQANLAVDNALSRLVHNPVIRAVRKGKAEKVGEEGLPFLEERVIGTWLQNTATDCEKSLSQRQDNVRVFSQLLMSSERFAAYLRAEEAFEREQQLLHNRKTSLESACGSQASAHAEAEARVREVDLNAELEALLKSAPSVNWQDPGVVNLLARLQPHAAGDSSVRSFIHNVKAAIALATELGQVVPPACGAFGLTAWLRDTVANWVSDAQTAIAYANDAVCALTAAESAAQTCSHYSDSLERQQETHRQVVANQQSLRVKIEKLTSRQSKISPAMISLEDWLSTADSQVYDTLKKCLQGRKNFTPDLIALPSGLLNLALEASCVPWEQSLAQCQVKLNDLIDKYREYDRFHKIAWELEQRLPLQQLLNETEVSRATEALKIHDLDFVQTFRRLERLAQYALEQANQPTLEAIRRQVVLLRQKAQPSYFGPALNQMASEVSNGIATSARQWLKQVEAQTELGQLLEEQLNKLVSLVADQQMEISTAQEQVETSRREADLKFKSAIALLQELAQLPQTPDKFRVLVKKYLHNTSNILAQIPQFSATVRSWKSRTEQLEALIASLDPFTVLSTIKDLLMVRLKALQEATESSKRQLTESQTQLGEIEAQLQQKPLESLATERKEWQSAFLSIPEHLLPEVPSTGLFALDFLRNVQERFESWQKELAQSEAYLSRYQHLVSNWISRLRKPSEQDHNELRRIYLDNANVIGITCVQAASREFSEEFRAFDVVIIDEVSKCTPPELLIPALKGKKLVMVGDHRQLPPMLDTSTLEEVALAIGSTREQLRFLEESLFKSQFEAAHKSIKQMLTTQYRMHPSIMGAINQFYEDRLQCGILEPDTKRAHNLAGSIIQEHHHLIWVKTPAEQGFEEQREGTSLSNIREVDVIERLCQQMEAVWASKVAEGEPKKEIAVITFYGAQLRKIDERLDSNIFPSLAIRTGTVDRFQGMERPIVIVSMVRNNSQRDVGFARKPERVNVAFSRAQELLVIVGCHSLFTQARGVGNIYCNVADVVRSHEGFIDVSRILC